MVATTDPTPAPSAFRRAVADLNAATWRPELSVEPIPAPQRIAPFAAAITADVMVGGEEVGSGRLVLLHDPAGNAAWQGTFRCVTFARAEVDPEMVTDPLMGSVGWSWLIDALAAHSAEYTAPERHRHLGDQRVLRRHGRGGAAGRGRGPRVLDARCWRTGSACRRTSRPGPSCCVRPRGCRRCPPGWC